jgi:glycine amidinotransferase
MGTVCSHNDFDPLREIIIGHPFHLSYAGDLSARLFYPNVPNEKWRAAGVNDHHHSVMRLHNELREDLNGFASILEAAGVRVRTVTAPTSAPLIRTPDWEIEAGHCAMIRDSVMVIGDELIETPPLVRARYFETQLYQSLFYEYFDSGAKWTVAPRPRMQDSNFDFSFVRTLGWSDDSDADACYEIMFDAPQVVRLGRDLLFNCSIQNHVLGARWLARHLGDRYRVHRVHTGIDDHLDCMFIPLRPGTLLVHEGFDLSTMPQQLATWDAIRYRPEARDNPWPDLPQLASTAIYMNVLSLDEDRVVVDADEPRLMALLERNGFTAIPCRWRHGRLIGGGFHCMTLDVEREGDLTEYLGG